MRYFYFLLFFNIFFISGFVFSYDSAYYQKIQSTIMKYSRPITVLEICLDHPEYTLKLAPLYPRATFVVIATQNPEYTFRVCKSSNCKNIVILNPRELPLSNLEILGRCEYFDVVILHDIFRQRNDAVTQVVRVLLSLGNNIFFENYGTNYTDYLLTQNPTSAINSPQGLLIGFEIKKPGLDIGRWNQAKNPVQEKPRYQVVSTYNEKYMIKNGQRTEWIAGVNLLTCIILRMLYPTASMIIENLKQFKKIKHNDLVVCNMIVQGARLVPIDFNDSRRDAKARKCIKAALALFKNQQRLQNPSASLKEYQEKLSHKK